MQTEPTEIYGGFVFVNIMFQIPRYILTEVFAETYCFVSL